MTTARTELAKVTDYHTLAGTLNPAWPQDANFSKIVATAQAIAADIEAYCNTPERISSLVDRLVNTPQQNKILPGGLLLAQIAVATYLATLSDNSQQRPSVEAIQNALRDMNNSNTRNEGLSAFDRLYAAAQQWHDCLLSEEVIALEQTEACLSILHVTLSIIGYRARTLLNSLGFLAPTAAWDRYKQIGCNENLSSAAYQPPAHTLLGLISDAHLKLNTAHQQAAASSDIASQNSLQHPLCSDSPRQSASTSSTDSEQSDDSLSQPWQQKIDSLLRQVQSQAMRATAQEFSQLQMKLDRMFRLSFIDDAIRRVIKHKTSLRESLPFIGSALRAKRDQKILNAGKGILCTGEDEDDADKAEMNQPFQHIRSILNELQQHSVRELQAYAHANNEALTLIMAELIKQPEYLPLSPEQPQTTADSMHHNQPPNTATVKDKLHNLKTDKASNHNAGDSPTCK